MLSRRLVRAHGTCPRCLREKPIGLVLCWACHHDEKQRNDGGYSPATDILIESFERALERSTIDG